MIFSARHIEYSQCAGVAVAQFPPLPTNMNLYKCQCVAGNLELFKGQSAEKGGGESVGKDGRLRKFTHSLTDNKKIFGNISIDCTSCNVPTEKGRRRGADGGGRWGVGSDLFNLFTAPTWIKLRNAPPHLLTSGGMENRSGALFSHHIRHSQGAVSTRRDCVLWGWRVGGLLLASSSALKGFL